jgi:hypothetical protein
MMKLQRVHGSMITESNTKGQPDKLTADARNHLLLADVASVSE